MLLCLKRQCSHFPKFACWGCWPICLDEIGFVFSNNIVCWKCNLLLDCQSREKYKLISVFILIWVFLDTLGCSKILKKSDPQTPKLPCFSDPWIVKTANIKTAINKGIFYSPIFAQISKKIKSIQFIYLRLSTKIHNLQN